MVKARAAADALATYAVRSCHPGSGLKSYKWFYGFCFAPFAGAAKGPAYPAGRPLASPR